jgi:periplasmic divalent cation tolerance protein
MPFIVVYITYPGMAEAHRITDALLGKRLIACANIFPVESKYRWKGKIERSPEAASIVKARRRDWDALKAEVERLHPYEVPDITRFDAEANPGYEAWLMAETRPAKGLIRNKPDKVNTKWKPRNPI